MTSPLASVLILTYNQEHLVEDTLCSVLAQQTSFPFEIVIGDDASLDGTADLCERLGKDFPLLRVLRHPVNLGHVGNFHATLAQCRGRYVALLGGDDIWVDPQKLEKQVAFLRDNPGYVISHTHNDLLDHATGRVIQRRQSSARRDGDCFEILAASGNFITASTALLDREALSADEIEVLKGFLTEDYPLWLMLSQKGKIHYLPDTCVHYRIIEGSLSRPPQLEKRVWGIQYSRSVAAYFCQSPQRRQLLARIHARNDVDVLRLLLKEGQKEQVRAFGKTIPLGRMLRFPRLLRYRLKAL